MNFEIAFFVSAFFDFVISIWHQSSSTFASMEDASTSGTFVYRGQHDDFDSPRTPKSRLGIQERTSSASLEDSALNLAEVVGYSIYLLHIIVMATLNCIGQHNFLLSSRLLFT